MVSLIIKIDDQKGSKGQSSKKENQKKFDRRDKQQKVVINH